MIGLIFIVFFQLSVSSDKHLPISQISIPVRSHVSSWEKSLLSILALTTYKQAILLMNLQFGDLLQTFDWNVMPSRWPWASKRTDILPSNLVKFRSLEIGCHDYRIVLKFDRHLGTDAADVPAKFQSDCNNVNSNPAASRLHEILRKEVHLLSEQRPWIIY